MKQTLYINLYRAGWYHRQGKPNTTNLHGGDVYTSERLAMENAEPDRGYITTVPFEVDMPGAVFANPATSEPTPLYKTRGSMVQMARGHSEYPWLLPYLAEQTSAAPGESLEVGDGHYGVSYEEWRDRLHPERLTPGLEQPSKAYKPTHGDYPFAHRSGGF
jgi:hypothetical protein